MRHLLILLLAASTLGAVEPEVPSVAPNDAPVVTDPDLKDATPAMREGSDEPVGGFKAPGMKGKSALSLGWSNGTMLGYSYWIAEALAVKASIGGSYFESQGTNMHSFTSKAYADAGLRLKAMELGELGFAFVQFGVHAGMESINSISKIPQPTYTTFYEMHHDTKIYGGDLSIGAELFWPGSRRVSLEAFSTLSANWRFTENFSEAYSNPVGAVVPVSEYFATRVASLDSGFRPITTALNIYF